VRRSSVQPSLLRWLAKDQAGTHIAFFEEREKFAIPRFPSSENKVAPISQANLQAAIKAALARAGAALVHENEGGETAPHKI
jgi:hypothetical protein